MTIDPAFGALVAIPLLLLAAACALAAPLNRRRAGIAAAACALGFVVGCGRSGGGEATSSPSPVAVASAPAAPALPPPQPLSPGQTHKALGAARNAGTIAVDVLDDRRTGMRSESTIDIPPSGVAYVLGWAFDETGPAPCGAVAVVVDVKRAFAVQYGVPRPDVAAHFNNPKLTDVGYVATLPGSDLGAGAHNVHIVCIGAKATWRSVKTLTITVR